MSSGSLFIWCRFGFILLSNGLVWDKEATQRKHSMNPRYFTLSLAKRPNVENCQNYLCYRRQIVYALSSSMSKFLCLLAFSKYKISKFVALNFYAWITHLFVMIIRSLR
jgi:hypothetical protein